MRSILKDYTNKTLNDSDETQPLKRWKDRETPRNIKTENEYENNETKKTLFGRLRLNLTVEPVLISTVVPWALARLAMQNLNLEKACLVKLKYSHEICDPLMQGKGELTEFELSVQKVISSIEVWKSIFQIGLPLFLVMFVGAWSDRTGNRKICILFPIIGEFFVCVSNAVCSFYFYEVPVEITMFLQALFPGITGGWIMCFLGVFSYISDITTNETRTFRIGIADLCMTAGVPIGTALGGYFLSSWGYLDIFVICAALYLLPIIYGSIFLKKITKLVSIDDDMATRVTFSELLSLQRDTISVVTKERSGDHKLKIILTLLLVAIVYGPEHAESLITYLFVRYRLSWNAVKFSMFSTYRLITNSLAAFLSISLFSKRWGFEDSTLCLISVISRLAGLLFTNFVHTNLQMYMVPLVEFFNATAFTSLRSMASKLVSSEELGKIYSMISLVETLAALIFNPLYATLYAMTMKQYTGAVYLFSAIMTLPAITLLLWFRQTRTQGQTIQKIYRRFSKSNEWNGLDEDTGT